MNDIRFQVLGFPVTVQPAFGLLLGIYLLFGLQAQQPLWSIASFGAVVFGSILLHELGHALMARRHGVPVGGIFIHGFGGHVTHGRAPAREQLLVSLAGPGAGLALGLPVLGLYLTTDLPPMAHTILWQLVFVNVFWSLFNLFPMLPLDGGQALGSLLSMTLGPERGWNVTTGLGMALGAAIAFFGFYSDWIFMMLIGGYCAWTSYQARLRLRVA